MQQNVGGLNNERGEVTVGLLFSSSENPKPLDESRPRKVHRQRDIAIDLREGDIANAVKEETSSSPFRGSSQKEWQVETHP